MCELLKGLDAPSEPVRKDQGGPAEALIPVSIKTTNEACVAVAKALDHDARLAELPNDAAGTADSFDPCVFGKPLSWFSAEIHSAKMREIEAEEDLLRRADLIVLRRLYGLCEASRKLIRSVNHVSVAGCAVQAWLDGPVAAEPSILAALVQENHRKLDAAYPSRRGRRKKSTSKQDAIRKAMKKAIVDGDKARCSLKPLSD